MDQGKSPVVDGCFRYFPRALLAVAMVSKSGADKYQVEFREKAWLAYTESDILNSEGRHMLKEVIEGKYDSDSNLLHKAHKAWNALAALEKELMSGTKLRQVPPAIPPMMPNVGTPGHIDHGRAEVVEDIRTYANSQQPESVEKV
jgi:hypothetical protein